MACSAFEKSLIALILPDLYLAESSHDDNSFLCISITVIKKMITIIEDILNFLGHTDRICYFFMAVTILQRV